MLLCKMLITGLVLVPITKESDGRSTPSERNKVKEVAAK